MVDSDVRTAKNYDADGVKIDIPGKGWEKPKSWFSRLIPESKKTMCSSINCQNWFMQL
jgi:hypothetical protein